MLSYQGNHSKILLSIQQMCMKSLRLKLLKPLNLLNSRISNSSNSNKSQYNNCSSNSRNLNRKRTQTYLIFSQKAALNHLQMHLISLLLYLLHNLLNQFQEATSLVDSILLLRLNLLNNPLRHHHSRNLNHNPNSSNHKQQEMIQSHS